MPRSTSSTPRPHGVVTHAAATPRVVSSSAESVAAAASHYPAAAASDYPAARQAGSVIKHGAFLAGGAHAEAHVHAEAHAEAHVHVYAAGEPLPALWLTGPAPPRKMGCWHSFWYLLNWDQVRARQLPIASRTVSSKNESR